MQDRRHFIKSLAALTPGILLPYVSCNNNGMENGQQSDRIGNILPQRKLGRTGTAVTMLGVGGFHIGWTTEKDAQETIETALQGGVRFFDTAESYNNGESERRYGRYLTPNYRDLVFIMTKTTAKDKATALQHLEESLERLGTDHLDLWQVHAIASPDDVNNRIEKEVLEAVLEAKESGKTKYIGFTGHRNPAAHVQMLNQTEQSDIFDTCQMPINIVDAAAEESFIERITPQANNRNIGLLAMKTLADGRFFSKKRRLDRIQWETDDPVVPDRVSMKHALYFAWSLPISVLITGAENAKLMQEKIELTQKFENLTQTQRQALVDKVTDLALAGKVEYYKKV